MIKKLDYLLLRNFIGPFVVTFFVALFVLVMQFLWLYMDELIGKGLDVWILIKLMVLMAMPLVPLALPLAVLLSSIMTFGSMGENFELVAIKSSGISLLRFMRPLFLFIVGISIIAFFFMNYIIPVTNLQSYSLLYDVRNAKPALNIRAGQFYNEIDGYSIKIGSKEEDGRTIHDIMIYDNLSNLNNAQVVAARWGEMIPTPDKKYLIFRLYDGWRYQDAASYNKDANNEQTRMHFKQWDKVFDLSNFKMARTSGDAFKGGHQFMNIRQIDEQLDSMKRDQLRLEDITTAYLAPYFTYASTDSLRLDSLLKSTKPEKTASYKKSILELFPDSVRLTTVQLATGNIRNAMNMVEISATDRYLHADLSKKFRVEWHRKFTLSIACLLMFLIGAPLGSIIRRGGIGLPLIFAIIFFMIFHLLSRTGEQYVHSNRLTPFYGMWLSIAIMVPIAFIMVYSAKNDARVFTKEWYQRQTRKLKSIANRQK